MPEDLAISLRGVGKTYYLYRNPVEQCLDALGLRRLLGRRQPPVAFEALKDVHLDVPRGAKLGIIGRNGAGKTTLLKLITRNFRPTVGSVLVNGRVQALLETGLGFHPEFTGYDNIRSSLVYNGLPGHELQRAIEDVVDFCKLGQFLHQPLKTYSLGMRSRLYFSCATAVNPEVLVIDEVLGSGDAYFAARSAERMQRLTSLGCTLLLVSHGMEQILQYCDEAVWLEQGTIVFQGPALETIKRYEQFIRHMQQAEKEAEGQEATPTPDAERIAEPEALADDWMEGLLRSKVAGPDRTIGEAPPTSAGGVSRWPSQRGVKLARLVMCTGDAGAESQLVRSGEPLDIVLHVRAEMTGRFRCRYLALLFTPEGRWLTRVYSPPDEFETEEGEVRVVTLRFDQMLLGNGTYVFSVAIYDDTELDDIANAVCYDLLSRSFEFRVVDRLKDDETLFHHPARWLLAQPA